MPDADPQLVQRRLEEFRRNLLDTSLRNRLIDFRTRTLAGKPLEKVVEVLGEDPVELVRILVTDGKAMSFVGKPDPRPPKKPTAELDDFGDPAALAELRESAEHELDTFVATGEPVIDRTDLKLNTQETVSALDRKLTKIWRDSRVGLEEQGVNVLFLALGTLEWTEADAEQVVRRAPLALLPVTLERTNGGAFRLKWDGGDLGGNLSIAAKVRAEFGIRLPELPDEPNLAEYYTEVAASVRSKPHWNVDRESVALGFFSYAKFLMYRDLDPAGWPADAPPHAHETLGALLDAGFDESEPGISEDAFLDPLRPVAQVGEVYDADGSQTLAILEANSGRSMIIEGPPGTGKSQTITNLIAEAIGNGKKVLFVAEKSAALDVVYRRLREANLGDACLELHSHKANKRGFYAELNRTVKIAAPREARAEADLKRLEEDRDALNAYADAINRPLEGRDVSPRTAMGRLVELGPEPSPEGRHDFSRMAEWDQTAFEARLGLVRRLQAHLATMGRPADHPYFGCTLDHLLPQDRDDLARFLSQASDATEAFHASANALAEALRVELPVLPADVERLRAWAAFVAHAPDVTGVAVAATDWEAAEPELRATIARGRRLAEIRDRLTGTAAPDALDREVGSLRDALRLKPLVGESLNGKSTDALSGVLRALDAAGNAASSLTDAGDGLARTLGVPAPATLSEVEPLASLAKRLGAAPDVRGMAVADSDWATSGATVREGLEAVRRYQAAHARYDAVLTEAAWSTDVRNDLSALEAHGKGFFRFLNGAYRQAMAASAVHFKSPPANPAARIEALRGVEEAREAEAAVAPLRGRLSALFGERWEGVRSPAATLAEAASWIEELHAAVATGKVPREILGVFGRAVDLRELSQTADTLRAKAADATRAIGDLQAALTSVGAQSANLPEEGVFAFLRGPLRETRSALRAVVPGANGFAESLLALDLIDEAQHARAEVQAAEPMMATRFGPKWQGEETDGKGLEALLDWTLGLHRSVRSGELPAGLVTFFAEARPRAGLDEAVRHAQETRDLAQAAVRRVLEAASLDRDPAAFTESPIAVQRDRIALWKSRLDDLTSLIHYNHLAAEARRQGLDESVAFAETWTDAGNRLAEAFARTWYTGVVREAVLARPVLARFDRASHEATVAEFAGLDSQSLLYNRAKVALAHWRSVPRGLAGGAMGWLMLEFAKKQNHRPIRAAMEKAGEAIQAIKPVFLMSPLSIAMYLPADGPRFDLVIFDEASQVKPEDAFGGILRADQTIVVGDSKQMPPTSFFDKLTSEPLDEDEAEPDEIGGSMKELESVLAMMSAKVPEHSPRRRDLRWHYRSRHDALIATSNRLFYDERLVVFPSPWRSGADAGLILRHDPNTVYARGGSRKNPLEARAVALAAQRHVHEHPKLTLGIAAFSKAQQEAIQDELDLLRRDDPAFAEFDRAHEFEPLFVKNLENVQGDERDVILISVGYGRDENGYVPTSFGPLNRDGGERRLNVLITRARVRCEVFTNLKAGDLRLTENPPRGVVALRTFLAFADTGSLDVPSATGMEPQSPFEEVVLARLRNAGYAVEPQVGSCGFYIDLAVRHPEEPQRFVLGIECDGAMYHRARSARDRDKLRQAVLESRGWRIHRIWSTDWFHHPDWEFDRLVAAIQLALSLGDDEKNEESARPSEFVELPRDETVTPEEGVEPYRLWTGTIPLNGTPLHEVTSGRWAEWIAEVVAVESPVQDDEVVRRIREAAGVARAGSRIQAAFETGVRVAVRQGRVIERDGFLYDPAQTQVPVRSRAVIPAVRRIETVAPEEAVVAMTTVIERSFGIEPDETLGLTARRLGFERITAPTMERLRAILEGAVAAGRFEETNGLLKIREKSEPEGL